MTKPMSGVLGRSQMVRQRPLKPPIAGSSPAAPTIHSGPKKGMKLFSADSRATHRRVDRQPRGVHAAAMHPVPSGRVQRQIAEVLAPERIFFDTSVGATHG